MSGFIVTTSSSAICPHGASVSILSSNTRVKAAGRVGARRWNLYFDGSVKALLPEHGLGKALAVLSELNDRHRILDKRIAAVDLRVDGRVVFSPPLPADPEYAPVNVAGVSSR